MLRVTTEDWAPADRVERWREEFGRHITGADVIATETPSRRFLVDMRLQRGGRLAMTRCRFEAVHQYRSRAFVTDGDDSCTVMVCAAGHVAYRHNGHSGRLSRGGVTLFAHDLPIEIVWESAAVTTLLLPAAELAPLLDRARVAGIGQPARSPTARMLAAYATAAFNGAALRSAERHLPALVADALAGAAGQDARPRLDARRAARVAEARRLIRAAALRPDAAAQVARRLGVSERTLQRDLAAAGITLGDELTAARLQQAWAWLRAADERRGISQLAFDAGFSDLSHFNRAFRARFGMTPGDVRRDARRVGAD